MSTHLGGSFDSMLPINRSQKSQTIFEMWNLNKI
jgi:hypothetical protein